MRRSFLIFKDPADLRWILLISFIAGIACTVNVAHAQFLTPQDIDSAGARRVISATVTDVIDPITFTLDNGMAWQASSLYIPGFTFRDSGPFAPEALKILSDSFVGKAVDIYQPAFSRMNAPVLKNRMGHLIGHAVRREDGLWMQGLLLRLGLAQMDLNKEMFVFSQQMENEESAARNENLGLWDDPAYQIQSSDNIPETPLRFQIVEGTVISASMRKNWVFLNFGADWRTDFTAKISPEDKRSFSRAGIDPLQWRGKRLRVRGWVDSYYGPSIQITHPAAVKVLEDDN